MTLLDQVSKYLAIRTTPTVCNSQSAFSLPISNVYVTVGVLLIVAYVTFKNRKTGYNFALALILGGGLSNLLDRIFRGCVLDFIDLKFWPSFNLADAAITIGALLILLKMIRVSFRKSNDSDA